jgi:hypothetical protein
MVGNENAALFFGQRYSERSSRHLNELLAIGVHTVAMSEAMNSKGIRGVDVVRRIATSFTQTTTTATSRATKRTEVSFLQMERNSMAFMRWN